MIKLFHIKKYIHALLKFISIYLSVYNNKIQNIIIVFFCRPYLAASVQVPLLTKQSIQFLLKFLNPRDKQLWGELGANWRIAL